MSRLISRVPARLSTKFVAATVAMSILFVSVGVYSVSMSRQTLEETVGEESVALALQFALSVDRGVYTKLHEIAIIALGRAIEGELVQSNAEFAAMEDPEAYIDVVDAEWSATPLGELTPLMDEILANNMSKDLTARLETHYIKEHGIDMYGEVLVTNRYGAVVAMTERSSDYRQDDETWWQTTRDEVHHVGDVEYDASSDMYGLAVCYSVLSDEGEFLGVMKAFVGIVELVTETQFESQTYDTTEVKVVTSDSRMIYSSTAFRMFEDVSTASYMRPVEGGSGYFTAVEGSRERLYAYSTFPGYLEYEGQSWLVVMSHDSEEVLLPVTELGLQIMAVSLGLLVLFIAVAYSLSASISRPISGLMAASSRMARGELKERVSVRSRDELGELAKAFNDMAAELEEMYVGLEAKVEERTREVDAANAKLQILGSITRHDALNQLSVLRGWLSMVEEDTKDPKTLEQLRKMKAASETLEEQLRFTGTYEKVGVTKPEWVDAKLALATSLPGLDLKGARVENGLKGLTVYADPMFPKVLRNLAENSVKHGKGTKVIAYSYHEDADGLVLAVEDDGGGIPADRKPVLFSRTRDAKGRMGYGLYLSKAILDITGITVSETGTPGVGARFEMRVPKGKYRVS